MERYNGVELDPEGAFVYYDDAQRALDAEREKVKELECYRALWKRRDDELTGVLAQLATLQAQLRQVEGERAKWEDIAGLRFAGDHKFVKEMELLKVENTTLRQLVEALINSDTAKDHDKAWFALRATLAAQDAGKEDVSHD